MKKWTVAAILLLCIFASSTAFARGGGGCLAKGTQVLTPSGSIAIEKLRVGDPVWSIRAGKLQKATVQALTEVRPDDYLEISTGENTFLITPEHPVMVAAGEFRIARLLQAGDNIYQIQEGSLHAVPIKSVSSIQSKQPAYNLLVVPGGTFLPANIVVHNKGCFLPDSEILKADGTTIRISGVKSGDELLSYSPEGSIVHTKVQAIISHKVDEYIVLKTDRNTLAVTAEHPFYTGNGTFKTLDILKAGDTIFAWDGQALAPQRIFSLQKINKRVRVFNLQTDQPNTFFAAGLAVHNKGGGGCFPAGTIIRTPAGQIPIENISANDTVQAVDQQGHIINASVEKLFATRSHVLSVKTNRGELRTTPEHPVGLTEGTFLEAGRLRPGDSITFRENGRLIPATVLQTTKSKERELVYNLSVNQPHTFLADDFVVHNKGGGGFSRSSSGSRSSGSGSKSSSDDIIEWFIIFGIFGTIVILMLKNKKPGKDENLDYVYSRAEITKKSIKTEKLLDFISKQDASLLPQELRSLSEAIFRRLQECWQKRDYAQMKALLMDNLFVQHTAQLQGLIRNNEINKIDELQVKHVDLVNVRYTEKPDQREFTALITASARDYYIDDRTDKFLRGDSRSAQFQEFWTFQRSGNQWLLREIEQSGESDILKDDNFVEMLTDQTIKGIYDDTASKEGSAGPWLEEPTGQKATRIDRILNFLVQTDKLWNRGLMLERARQVFLSVYLARETSNPASVPAADLFPQVAESLRKQMEQWQMEGNVTEYRNLCVRKAELILIRNYADSAKDEFTVRISAHAQKIVRKGKMVLTEQQYVTPFEEYWTFGRLDKIWKLKEVLPPSRGKKLIAEENVDEESSAQQMEWYARQTRAN